MKYILNQKEYDSYKKIMCDVKLNSRQKDWTERAKAIGDFELLTKLRWLDEHGIVLNDWQLVEFTGHDRRIGKTYVSMFINIFNGTTNVKLDKDYDAHSHQKIYSYLKTLKKLSDNLVLAYKSSHINTKV